MSCPDQFSDRPSTIPGHQSDSQVGPRQNNLLGQNANISNLQSRLFYKVSSMSNFLPTLNTLFSFNPSRVTNPVSSLSPQESWKSASQTRTSAQMYRKLLVQWKGWSFQSWCLSPSTITNVCQSNLLGSLDHLLNRVIVRHSHTGQEAFKVDILLNCIAAFHCLKTSTLAQAYFI